MFSCALGNKLFTFVLSPKNIIHLVIYGNVHEQEIIKPYVNPNTLAAANFDCNMTS